MTKDVKEYLDGLEKALQQDSYDVDKKYGRAMIFSKYNKSNNTYKISLGELFGDFDNYENKYNININDFYIIAKGYEYTFKKIQKEIFLILSTNTTSL
ncbi:hypothetical protein [Sulfurimonas sp.]|uniref:hypothetical protein n=1 Tax=Sulfurimonas sp. TaxID=2022749 RepID=UPI0025E62969|nr:hypothetical protein [Sulfurimonas sp.]